MVFFTLTVDFLAEALLLTFAAGAEAVLAAGAVVTDALDPEEVEADEREALSLVTAFSR